MILKWKQGHLSRYYKYWKKILKPALLDRKYAYIKIPKLSRKWEGLFLLGWEIQN